MSEAWIQLLCPACDETWEANPSDLPAPDEGFECPHCGSSRPTAEFMRTGRDLEILEDVHEAW